MGGERRPAMLAVLVVAAVLALPGCGGSNPFRVGVIADCVGVDLSLHDAELAAARLPLREDDNAGGRRVEVVPGCTEIWEFSTLTAEVRRLVEDDGVEAVIAAGSGPDEVALREVARLYPDVPFLPVVHGPREVTLRRRAPNVFRFLADQSQSVAGLGAYAYRRLGWRRAAIVLFNWDVGWGNRAGFEAEFCALGGRIARQIPLEEFDPGGADVDAVPGDVDGVAVFTPTIFEPGGFLTRLASRYRDPARRILLGPSITADQALLQATAPSLAGVVGSSYSDPARMRAYLREYRRAVPGSSAAVAGSEQVAGYRDAMIALLAGLDGADGSTSRLPGTLAQARVALLSGPTRLDARHQAVTTAHLVRVGPAGAPVPGVIGIASRPGVDQSLNGLVGPHDIPGELPPACVSRPRSSR